MEKKSVELDIYQLQKSFSHLTVLKGIDLKINSGEFVAIVGKSGCGKSTLLRHIAGLEEATSGGIIQDHTPIKGLNTKARMMYQDARLLPWKTVLENVGVGFGLKKGWEKLALNALEQVGLSERVKEWPTVLSGGQKQRVALARALVSHPPLLLLDEPLGALDALTRMEMQTLIEKLWKEHKFTSILVTHDVTEAITLADRVILIENGSIMMDLTIPLQRPRNRMQTEFTKLEDKVLARVLGKTEKSKKVLA